MSAIAIIEFRSDSLGMASWEARYLSSREALSVGLCHSVGRLLCIVSPAIVSLEVFFACLLGMTCAC